MAFPIERRNVTLRYHGSKISGSQQWGEKQKTIGLDWSKTTLRVDYAFLYIS